MAEERAVLGLLRVGELDPQRLGQVRGRVMEGGGGVAVLVGNVVREDDAEGAGEEVLGVAFGLVLGGVDEGEAGC